MPVLSPAFKVVCYASDGRGVALSSSNGSLKVDALIHSTDDVKWLYKRGDLSDYLPSILLNPTLPLLVRPFTLPLKNEAEIDQALRHEVEGLFPTPQGEIAFDRILFPFQEGDRRLTLLMTTKEALEKSLKPFQEKGIEPEVVTATPAALAEAAHKLSPSMVPRGILYLEGEEKHFLIEKGGKLLGSIRLNGSIIWAIGSLTRQLALPIAEEILVFGSFGKLTLPAPYQAVFPPLSYGLTEEEWKTFTLPFGGALGALVGSKNGINLRETLLPPPLPWKRVSRSLAILSAIFICSLLSLYGAGVAYLSWREDLLREKWASTLSLIGKTDEIFEQNFHDKTGEPIVSLLDLTPEEIATRANFVQKELNSTPILFPLHPNVPRVSDLLAWLGSLEEVGGQGEGRIEIVSLQYVLTKRPEMEKKQERYQVKVDLEFSTPSPKWAREFHDLLISPNPFVDPKGEVKWNVSRGSYKTSFLLKDHTAYVH